MKEEEDEETRRSDKTKKDKGQTERGQLILAGLEIRSDPSST